jgi:probable HAF family extracellular repeat protein
MNIINRIRQRQGRWSWTIALIFLIGPLASLPASAETYEIHDLGAEVSPTDISNYGTIVGSLKTDTGTVAFCGLSGSTLEVIPGTTVANAVNDIDQITGNTPTGAFLRDGCDPLLNGSLLEWDGYGGYGLNEAGQISGNKQLNNPYRASPLPLDPAIYTLDIWNNLGIATVYSRGTRDGVYADIYKLDDITDDGYSVGSHSRYGLVNSSSSILIGPGSDTVTYLPIPNGGYATAINSRHMVVGATGSNSLTDEYSTAYLYNYSAGTLTPLGTLNGGLTSSAADINESNQVVGTSWLVTQPTSLYDPTQYHAFLWQDGTMSDLNDMIPADSGWVLTKATAINDHGEIVGTGIRNGKVHGFLLTAAGAGGTAPPPSVDQPPPVDQAPIAMASADATTVGTMVTVHFSAAGSYDPDGSSISYAWDFGDGATATGENVTHDYRKAGIYTATLTVTDSEGLSASADIVITVEKSRGKSR